MVINRVSGRNREPIRPARLRFTPVHLPLRRLNLAHPTATACMHAARVIERLQLLGVDLLDIPADAPLGKRKGHPRLELCQYLRLSRRVLRKIEVDSICPRIHQPSEPPRAGDIVAFEFFGIQKQPLPQILPDGSLALRLRPPPKRGQVIHLNPVEVILALREDHPEHSIRIARSMHMRDAPVVAHDCHSGRFGFPSDLLRRCRSLCHKRPNTPYPYTREHQYYTQSLPPFESCI